jgi:ABC-2 type transport system ATP-binding protein/lipopolysaccharide transport system ATP-binding protein
MIHLENVSIRYRVPRGGSRSLKEHVVRRLAKRITFDEFEALKSVSLDVADGENVGVIGRNGAGKSTMFKAICRVVRPSEGRVVVRGRVAPLLELGLGMNSELTGRENVMLQGALLGFSRHEMQERLVRITEFSELAGFIDAPTRTYSTGMVARLAFSVATDVDPDILLIDEALAVGDERFQAKCHERMAGFRSAGKTVMVVSHSLGHIRATCSRVLWLDQGRLIADGPMEVVAEAYHEWSGQAGEDAAAFAERRGLPGRSGTGVAFPPPAAAIAP